VAPFPEADPNFSEQQAIAARIQCESFIRHVLAEDLLEGLEDTISPPLPRFEALHDPEGRQGVARMAAQYTRSNCDPSQRCTLALPGASKYRMKAGDTDIGNLVVAGDWIDNGIRLACMEGAFKSGLLAAEALREKGRGG
jgi:hypothetical protein